jgi:hypothetical protein
LPADVLDPVEIRFLVDHWRAWQKDQARQWTEQDRARVAGLYRRVWLQTSCKPAGVDDQGRMTWGMVTKSRLQQLVDATPFDAYQDDHGRVVVPQLYKF